MTCRSSFQQIILWFHKHLYCRFSGKRSTLYRDQTKKIFFISHYKNNNSGYG